MSFLCTNLESEADWKQRRMGGIGASESAILFGASRWGSPYQLWALKRGVLDKPHEDNEAMHWGRRLEATIADEYAAATGRKLIDRGRFALLQSTEHPFLLATLDREIEAVDELGPGVLEVKNTSAYKWDEWQAAPPLEYQIQVQHQLAVTGYRHGALAVLIGGNKFGWVRIERNETFIASLIRRAEAFWRDVVDGREPPVDGHEATTEALKALHPSDSGATVELPPEAADWDAELQQLKGVKDDLEARERELKNKLLAAIGDASFATLPGGVKYSYKTIQKKEHQVKATSFRQLRRIA